MHWVRLSGSSHTACVRLWVARVILGTFIQSESGPSNLSHSALLRPHRQACLTTMNVSHCSSSTHCTAGASASPAPPCPASA